MRVATHQPLFLPWPGLFFKGLSADVLVLLDKVQFPLGRSWMTRNRLKSDQGELWLRVPVQKKGRGKQIIRQVEIHSEAKWHQKHLQSIRQNYAHAPYLADHLPQLEAIYGRHPRRLSALNYDLICYLWKALGLKSTLILQSDLAVSGQGTELLVSICRTLKANTYATLPPAEKYLEREKFTTNGIQIIFTPFHPPIYPQLWGDFRYNLSTLDLLLNCGPKSLETIARSAISQPLCVNS
jgi:hypothetical protein